MPPVPPATSEVVRNRMVGQRRRDTAPELALRRALHAAGYRYRVEYPALPGSRRRVDIAFTRARLAVFVDGCWWHGCPQHGHSARSNATWWAEKLRRNHERDLDTDQRLRAAGWTTLRAWEHDDPTEVVEQIRLLLPGAGTT